MVVLLVGAYVIVVVFAVVGTAEEDRVTLGKNFVDIGKCKH